MRLEPTTQTRNSRVFSKEFARIPVRDIALIQREPLLTPFLADLCCALRPLPKFVLEWLDPDQYNPRGDFGCCYGQYICIDKVLHRMYCTVHSTVFENRCSRTLVLKCSTVLYSTVQKSAKNTDVTAVLYHIKWRFERLKRTPKKLLFQVRTTCLVQQYSKR